MSFQEYATQEPISPANLIHTQQQEVKIIGGAKLITFQVGQFSHFWP
jgi:hypothetical protein